MCTYVANLLVSTSRIIVFSAPSRIIVLCGATGRPRRAAGLVYGKYGRPARARIYVIQAAPRAVRVCRRGRSARAASESAPIQDCVSAYTYLAIFFRSCACVSSIPGSGAGAGGAASMRTSPSCDRSPMRQRSTSSLSFMPPMNPSGRRMSVASARSHRIRGTPSHVGTVRGGGARAVGTRRGTGFSCGVRRAHALVDMERVQGARDGRCGVRHVERHVRVGAFVKTDHVSSRTRCTLPNVSRTTARHASTRGASTRALRGAGSGAVWAGAAARTHVPYAGARAPRADQVPPGGMPTRTSCRSTVFSSMRITRVPSFSRPHSSCVSTPMQRSRSWGYVRRKSEAMRYENAMSVVMRSPTTSRRGGCAASGLRRCCDAR